MRRNGGGGVRGPIGFLSGLIGGLQQGMPGLLEAQRQAREAARQAKKDEDEKQVKTDQRMRDAEAREQKKLAPYLRELDALAKRYQGNPEALKVIAARRERLKRGYAQVTGRDVPEVPYSGEEGTTFHPEELAHATAGLKLPGLSDADQAAAKAKEAAEIEGRVQRYRNWVAAHPRHRMNVDAGEQWLRSGKTGPIQSPEFPDVHFDPLDQKNRAWGPSQEKLERRQTRRETRYRKEHDAAVAERDAMLKQQGDEDLLGSGAARAYVTAFSEALTASPDVPKAARAAAQARQEYLRVHGPRIQAAAPVRPEPFMEQFPKIGEAPRQLRPQPGELPSFPPALRLGVGSSLGGTLRAPGGLADSLWDPAARALPASGVVVPAPPPTPPAQGTRRRGSSAQGAGTGRKPAGPGTGRLPGQKPGGFPGKGSTPALPQVPGTPGYLGPRGAAVPGVSEDLERAAQLQGRPLTEAERWAVKARSWSRFT